jgi:hypothetical protein
MTTPSLRRVRILSAAVAIGALAACGGGSSPAAAPPPPTSGPTDLSVTVTAPTDTVVPGKKAPWIVVVTNEGQWAAPSTVISNTVDEHSTISEVHCQASANTHCPLLLGASMTTGQLAAGESLTFEVDVVVAAGTNGTVFESATVEAPNDTTLANNTRTATASVQSYDVSVSNVAAGPTVGAGLPTTFTATIANSGPVAATNLTITEALTVPPFKLPLQVSCAAAGGAACPADLSFPISVDALPVGGTLTLSMVTNVAAAARGPGSMTIAVQVDNDSSSGNNSSTATTTVVDARNGTYRLYAADAKVYAMSADFDALTWSVVGNGVDASGALTTSDALTYAISPREDIHASAAAADLLVGAFDFGAGPLPYIAARSFATSIEDVGSAPFTVFGRSTNHLGTASSTIDSQSFDASGTMANCTSQSQIFRISACPSSFLTSFALTFDGADITGVDSVNNDTIHFRVAKSGASRLVLRAETDAVCDCARFGVGVTDNVLALQGSFSGASSTGSTGSLGLTDTRYAVDWVSPTGVSSSDTATLGVQGASAPVGLRGGVRASDGSFLYVVENAPIALVVGSFTSPANGTIELWGQ